jgi:hypothetical protein
LKILQFASRKQPTPVHHRDDLPNRTLDDRRGRSA